MIETSLNVLGKALLGVIALVKLFQFNYGFFEDFSGMFKRRSVIRSIVSKENLFRLDLLEQVNVPRLKKFSLNVGSKFRYLFLAFKHVKNGNDVLFRTSKEVE